MLLSKHSYKPGAQAFDKNFTEAGKPKIAVGDFRYEVNQKLTVLPTSLNTNKPSTS
jgi:hypothetical protein